LAAILVYGIRLKSAKVIQRSFSFEQIVLFEPYGAASSNKSNALQGLPQSTGGQPPALKHYHMAAVKSISQP
jgi:hypothetical protein